jgi:mRNA interferase MazF
MANRATHRSGRFAVWDVVRVAFPFADAPVRRNRPALVISASDVHERFDVLWVLMITSAGHSSWPGDVPVSDLSSAGLPVPCVVRTEKITTIDARYAERVGRLAEGERAAVVASMRRILGAVLVSS